MKVVPVAMAVKTVIVDLHDRRREHIYPEIVAPEADFGGIELPRGIRPIERTQ